MPKLIISPPTVNQIKYVINILHQKLYKEPDPKLINFYIRQLDTMKNGEVLYKFTNCGLIEMAAEVIKNEEKYYLRISLIYNGQIWYKDLPYNSGLNLL